MSTTLQRPTRNHRSRRSNDPANRPQPTTPIYITHVEPGSDTLTITFDQPVMLNGLPGFRPNDSITPIEAVQTAPDTIEIQYSGTIQGLVDVNVGFQDPAVRNASGGFVTSDRFTL